MKTLMKCLVALSLIVIVSCRDSKKEEEETKAAVEKIDKIEAEVEELTEDINMKEKDLEEALKELDSL